ncbi:MAG TPA: DUF2141 domain-containing protein [Allosphingosinicella sp.]|nr:DUF2141 domain-containing protein [Allosphingosinicella sp.]
MFKLMSSIAAAALVFAAQPTAAQAALGPDAASCRTGSNPAVLVNVTGFKNRAGRLRVQLYGSNPADFLAKGKKLKRIDLPVTRSGPMAVCVAVPRAGQYAIAVRHDVDNDGSDWGDGGGFSRNPKIALLSPKPRYSEVAIPVGQGVQRINVVLNYRQGLSIGPIGSN